ncbi:hypothetical protein CC2G_014008 [Coprinopsis cinerea AmutBmut pab1-1]|nr:hypothetical protein CC2G_014008 [Coprinopsis cinerea AmutBmut pab1-1]
MSTLNLFNIVFSEETVEVRKRLGDKLLTYHITVLACEFNYQYSMLVENLYEYGNEASGTDTVETGRA